MKTLINKVQLIGRLGKDPQILEFSNEQKSARFALATNEIYTRKDGGRTQRTQWHQVVARGATALLVEKILRCGQEIYLEGRLVNRSWKDKNGQMRYTHEILLEEFYLTHRQAS